MTYEERRLETEILLLEMDLCLEKGNFRGTLLALISALSMQLAPAARAELKTASPLDISRSGVPGEGSNTACLLFARSMQRAIFSKTGIRAKLLIAIGSGGAHAFIRFSYNGSDYALDARTKNPVFLRTGTSDLSAISTLATVPGGVNRVIDGSPYDSFAHPDHDDNLDNPSGAQLMVRK